ncbi:tetratricopeptide repeat protein [Caldithrix abyssi]|uniref:Tetratricopeptide TPR_1 repeat-containing protein n=1 Tax=Caldithrix abyssi DSM 13497 TaxID=880073 RepID=H1XR31_CALAY|nr:tetratricopeptide repeat protein [Caldithrix abyssi]APF20047.1 Tetratricopeptide repeat-containing protein [Caldithrix abyssi DSM 13497]EHO40125.1 Tetratricopeptide TPR_1 repeat-containing protein [Caldithrix abyssi DSM 13497]
MDFFNLHLLSTYLKKWSYNDNKVTFNYSYCCEIGYDRSHVDMRLGSPVNMVNEFLNNVFHRAKEKINEQIEANPQDPNLQQSNGSNIILVNEPEVKRKLSVFFSKILKEFNNNKRSRGRSRIISTRSLDFYYNDFEYEPLSDEIKFYVHLNRGLNKMNGDLYSNAVDDLKNALAFKPEDPQANKNIAKALMKLGRFEEAVKHLEIYTQAEKSDVALHQLGLAFMKLGDLDRAEEIYKQIEKEFPDSLYGLFGRALINYKRGKGFKQKLDKIYKINPEWLAEHLRTEWSFNLPGYEEDEEAKWNAATAARYLGFNRPFDLTRKAFNNEIPSYFDSEKGTIRFVKAELDAWVELVNRYKLEPQNYETHEELLTEQEKQKAQRKRGRRPKKDQKNEAVEEQVA